ncbi:MAG: hypothetical protein AB8C02_11375 [Halioglobus sp.]
MVKILKRLHRDDSAQISFLAVAGALVFVSLLAMLMNSNDLVRERIRNQEVADVVALSAGTWNARGLNIISMINVLNTKLLSMTVLVNSLNKTLPVVITVGEVQAAMFQALSGIPPTGPAFAALAAIVRAQVAILKGMKKVIEAIENAVTACGKAAWTIMDGLELAADGVDKSFVAIATGSSAVIAEQNGVTFGLSLNGGVLTGSATESLTLPVSKGETSDFCNAMKNGGPGFELEGYSSGQGPVRLGKSIWDIAFIPFFNLFPHPVFLGFYNFHLTQLGCTGEPKSKEQEEAEEAETYFETLEDCRKYEARSTWQRYEYETDWIANGGLTNSDFIQWRPFNQDDSGDTLSDEDKDKYSDLDKWGPTGPADNSGPPFSPGSAYNLLEDSERKRNKTRANCGSSSGYPNISDSDPGSLLCLGGCTPLNSHPAFDSYNPGIRSESAGMYYLASERDDREIDGNTRYRYKVTVWVLAEAGSKVLSDEERDEYLEEIVGDDAKPGPDNDSSNSSDCRNRIQPFLLDEDSAANRNRYIALAYTNIDGTHHRKPFWSNYFTSPPDRITAYAQAQTYNKLSEDMFTQDWRVRLEQTNLLESAVESGLGFDLSVGGNNSFAAEFIGSVNNH